MTTKKKYNLVGGGFNNYDGENKASSIHKQESQCIEWVNHGAEDTFYVDEYIGMVFDDEDSIKKYGWLLESAQIKPQVIEDIKRNYLHYVRCFDAIFTHNKELCNLHRKFKYAPLYGSWVTEPKMYEKSKLISMICSNKVMCQGHQHRLSWAQKLQGKVDFYGRGFNEIHAKEEGLCDYMFSVAIENASYDSYFTEKVQDCFSTATIPIYYGAPDIGEHFNPDGIITLTDDFDPSQLTPEIYYDKIDAVKENLEIIKSLPINEDNIYKNYLQES
tara:strand:- start:3284 stop:4105 length:822 start_codon:yes stop_codon:yes gene_type:complete